MVRVKTELYDIRSYKQYCTYTINVTVCYYLHNCYKTNM